MKVIEELIDIVSSIKTMSTTGKYHELPGLIEQWQSWAERLEGSLEDRKDFLRFREKRSKLKVEIKILEEKKAKLIEENKERRRKK